jgi:hypothetical protein
MTSIAPVTVYLRWPERDLLALSPLVRLRRRQYLIAKEGW